MAQPLSRAQDKTAVNCCVEGRTGGAGKRVFGDVWITCVPGAPAHGEAPVLVVTFAAKSDRFYTSKV